MKTACHFVWTITGKHTFRTGLTQPGRLGPLVHPTRAVTHTVCARDLDEAVEMFAAIEMQSQASASGHDHKFTISDAHQSNNLVYYPVTNGV